MNSKIRDYDKKNRIIYVLLIFFVMFITDSPIFQINSNALYNRISQISLLLSGLFVFVLYNWKEKRILFDDKLKLFLLLLLSLFITWALNLDAKLVVPIKIATLIFGFFLVKIIDVKKFIDMFIKIMIVIAIYSLVVFIFKDRILQFSFLPRMITFKNLELVIVGLSNIPNIISGSRNWGPFWEPGAYQIYLNLALILTLFTKNIQGIKKMIFASILVITIFTLKSTAGLITLVSIIVAYVFSSTRSLKTVALKMAFLTFVLSFGYIMLVEYNLFNIVIIDKMDTISGASRIDTIVYGFQAWRLKPLFGYGSNYTEVMYNLAGYELSITNTTIVNFVAYGTFFGTYYIMSLKKFIDSFETNMIVRLILYASMLLLFSGSTLIYSPIVSILMFLRIKNNEKGETVFYEKQNIDYKSQQQRLNIENNI